MSKLTCTLKGVVPPKLLPNEDASHISIYQIIWEKLAIISFLYHSMDSSSKNLKGYPTPSCFFYFAMGFH